MSRDNGRISLNATLLKEHRKKAGLSQEKLAEQCLKKGIRISVSSIKRAELGMNVIHRTAFHLADFYGIPVEKLLADTRPIQVLVASQSLYTSTLPPFPYYKKRLLTIVLEIGY